MMQMRQEKWLHTGENERRDGDQHGARNHVDSNGHAHSGGQEPQTAQPQRLLPSVYKFDHCFEASPDASERIA